ncbi:MAG: zinc-ribbon domain-containing protein [Clostridiales bacterium]|nr:zinc-ribbon domain-containing protein [Clostridiales bacterium]
MYCPKCGHQIPDGSRFCPVCGCDLSAYQSNVRRPNDKPVPPKHTHNPLPVRQIGIAVAAVAAVAVIVAVVFGVRALFSVIGNSSNAYVYLSDGDYELITDLSKGDIIEIASSRSEYTYSSLLSFSPDGKYVYYYTKYDSSNRTGTLCRAEYGKLKSDSSKNDDYIVTIASNVALGFQCIDDETVIYKNGDDTLYYYDGSDVTQLAKSVNEFYTEGTERVVYTTGTYDEGYTLYGVDVTDPDSKVKLASNYAGLYIAEDFDNIYYTKTDSDYNAMLYVVGFDKDSEQIGKNVNILELDDGTVYFTAESGETLSLYDYVDDTYASHDEGVTEPDKDDYLIPTYSYNQLSVSDNEDDYDEIYTSCSKTVYFFHTAIKNKTSSSYTLAQEFTEKYLDSENSDGYFVVTETIKKELQEMCDEYGQGYDNEWLEFCFSKEEDGTEVDEDAYYAAYSAYEEAADRIYIRETLQNSENDYALKTLYCYADGKLTAVAENVLSTKYCNGAVLYNTADMVTETVSMTSVYSISDVTALFAIDYSAENYLLCYGTTTPAQVSASAAEDMDDAYYDSGYISLLVIGSGVYMTSDEDIYFAEISNNTLGEFTFVSDDAYVLMYDDSGIYYECGGYSSNSGYYIDLYKCVGGEDELVARDILENEICIYEDETVLAYTDYTSYGYELTIFDAKGEKAIIADDVSFYLRCADGTVLYISDGDLYSYDDGERTLVGRDADWCWVLNTMEPSVTYSY